MRISILNLSKVNAKCKKVNFIAPWLIEMHTDPPIFFFMPPLKKRALLVGRSVSL